MVLIELRKVGNDVFHNKLNPSAIAVFDLIRMAIATDEYQLIKRVPSYIWLSY